MDLKQAVVLQLPYLRRYARALTGDQAVGDRCVRDCLAALAGNPAQIGPPEDVRRGLFALFHRVVQDGIAEAPPPAAPATTVTRLIESRIRERVAVMDRRDRQALLLVHIEGFSPADAAFILRTDEARVKEALTHAWETLKHQDPVRVLIIEDEPVIALDVAATVTDLGHAIVGIARNSAQALSIATREEPQLVLADIQLEDGDTGIQAVKNILSHVRVPVVFVTAFPERLLTGAGLEPTFLVTKPFESDTLRVTIAQALFCGVSSDAGGLAAPRSA